MTENKQCGGEAYEIQRGREIGDWGDGVQLKEDSSVWVVLCWALSAPRADR